MYLEKIIISKLGVYGIRLADKRYDHDIDELKHYYVPREYLLHNADGGDFCSLLTFSVKINFPKVETGQSPQFSVKINIPKVETDHSTHTFTQHTTNQEIRNTENTRYTIPLHFFR